MVISRLPSGGGGSKELHGAIINVSVGTSLVGQTVYLYKSDDTEVAHKVIPNTKAVSFTDILETDTYTAKITYQGLERTLSQIVSADDILAKNTFDLAFTGASINVSTTNTTLGGQTVELYYVNGSTETKVAEGVLDSLGLTYTFTDIQIDGTYKTVAGDYDTTAIVTTENILAKDTILATINTGLYIYKDGNECVSVTGGWNTSKLYYDNKYSSGTRLKNADHLYGATSEPYKLPIFVTNNVIDFSKYSKLNIEFEYVNPDSGASYYQFGNVVSNGGNYVIMADPNRDMVRYVTHPTKTTLQFDLLKYTNKNSVFGFMLSSSGVSVTIKVYKIWFT